LIRYRNGEILDLENHFEKVEYKNTAIYQMYKMYLDIPEKMQQKLFDE
jgi:hypothetical protein